MTACFFFCSSVSHLVYDCISYVDKYVEFKDNFIILLVQRSVQGLLTIHQYIVPIVFFLEMLMYNYYYVQNEQNIPAI